MTRAASLLLVASCAFFVYESARGGFPAGAAFAAAVAALVRAAAGGWSGFWRERPAAGVFLVCFAAYLSTFRWHGGDDLPNTLVPLALLNHGTPALDAYYDAWFAPLPQPGDFLVRTPGGLLSVYPIAAGLLALPVFVVPALADPPMSAEFLHQLSKTAGALVTAASAAAVYKSAEPRASREWALLVAFLYGLGSWAFSVSGQAIWQHGPAALGVALALAGLSRRGFKADLIAGFGAGLAVAARPDHVFYLAGVLAFVLWRARGRLPGVVLGGALPAALLAWYWLAFTGTLRPPEMGVQSAVFGGFDLGAFLGLVASPRRGLLWYFPPVLFALWAAGRRRAEGLAPLLAAAVLGLTFFLSFYENWVGGRSYGSRYFASAAAAFCWMLAGAEDDLRGSPRALTAFLAASAAAVVIHAVGGYFNWPGTWETAATVAQAWDWRTFPLAFVFTRAGGLGPLPVPLRAAVGAAVLAAAWAGVAALRARLLRPAGQG